MDRQTAQKPTPPSAYTRRYLLALGFLAVFAAARHWILLQKTGQQIATGLFDIASIERTGLWFLVTTLLALAGVGVFVFRPMVRRIRDETAKQAEYQAHLEDLVERRTAEIRREERKFRTLVESAPEGLILTDRGGIIRLVNARTEKIFGYDRDELVGRPLDLLIPERLREKHKDYQDAYFQDPKPRAMGAAGLDLAGQRKDGSEFPAEISLSPLETEDGPAVMSLVRDMTESRQQERLATIGQISGSIAHELRNPLATIDSSVYYLKAKCKDPDSKAPKVEEHLGRIRSAVQTCVDVIQGLLDLTRLQPPQFESLNLVTLLESSVEESRKAPEVEVVKDFPGDAILIQGDARQLRMVFSNIVKNASDAMKGQGAVRIAAAVFPASVWLSIADGGPGIPKGHLERIFEPLFTTKKTGVGFGLAIAKMIVERHQGKIWAESTPGRGATFHIQLPLSDNTLSSGPSGSSRRF